MIFFKYCNSSGEECSGEIALLSDDDPIEMDIYANNWRFHTIVGRQIPSGNYICIPNWSIGSELAYLQDEFWNCERLCNYTDLAKDNAIAISSALAAIDKWIKEFNTKYC